MINTVCDRPCLVVRYCEGSDCQLSCRYGDGDCRYEIGFKGETECVGHSSEYIDDTRSTEESSITGDPPGRGEDVPVVGSKHVNRT